MGIAFTKFNKLLCIVGPTATGKTDLALTLAKKLSGQLVACDSRQVYKKLDLGTGKESADELPIKKHSGYWILDGIKVWLYDQVDFGHQYSVSEYIKDASFVVQKISNSYQLPIIVGGTGLYFDGLLNGIDTNEVPENVELRNELAQKNVSELQKQLQKIDEDFYNDLNNSERNNPRRLIRKIEIFTYLNTQQQAQKKDGLESQFTVLKIGLTAEKNVLNKRIEERVVRRVKQGMIEETKRLHEEGLSYPRMRELGLEYGVMADFLEGVIKSEAEFINILQQQIKQYARRQITWFKRDKEIVWFDITDKNYQLKVEKLVSNWYNS